ncbi:DUF427 domain-containing protein [Methylobacterium marchantiae]|uniref:DUF427 domain-containing protein n=1 Tax=Methylobacterium marchantiae TaxID=600331 RepID=A0ABW3X2E1_9HYPH|nr:hypothetical protein AIGOOFII_2407 [Methylobacterium marchantiae]
MSQYITIEKTGRHVRVVLAGVTIAESDDALSLKEGASGPVLYIPRADARWEHFTKTTRSSHCPHKGDASYYTVTVGDVSRPDSVWSYETPFAAVAAIKDHLAFYPNKVDAIEVG